MGKQLWQRPVFFDRNRVYRVYLGGKLFHDFLGDAPEDGFYPEEWVASTVHAMNAVSKGPFEGISMIEGTDEAPGRAPGRLPRQAQCAAAILHTP